MPGVMIGSAISPSVSNKPGGSGGSGGSFDWSQYQTLVFDPDTDLLYQTDAETTPAVSTGDPVVRWYPGSTPIPDYLLDATSPPVFQNQGEGDGINGRNTVRFTGSANDLVSQILTLGDVMTTSQVVMSLTGRVNTPPTSGFRQMFGDIFAGAAVLEANLTSQEAFLNVAPTHSKSAPRGVDGKFWMVMRWSGSTFDLWMNGTKLASTGTSGTIVASNLLSAFRLLGGVGGASTSVDWEIVLGTAGATANIADADMEAVSDQLKLLLGSVRYIDTDLTSGTGLSTFQAGVGNAWSHSGSGIVWTSGNPGSGSFGLDGATNKSFRNRADASVKVVSQAVPSNTPVRVSAFADATLLASGHSADHCFYMQHHNETVTLVARDNTSGDVTIATNAGYGNLSANDVLRITVVENVMGATFDVAGYINGIKVVEALAQPYANIPNLGKNTSVYVSSAAAGYNAVFADMLGKDD